MPGDPHSGTVDTYTTARYAAHPGNVVALQGSVSIISVQHKGPNQEMDAMRNKIY